jgi:hypothetical protein
LIVSLDLDCFWINRSKIRRAFGKTVPGEQQFFDALPIPASLFNLVEVASIGVARQSLRRTISLACTSSHAAPPFANSFSQGLSLLTKRCGLHPVPETPS